MNEPTLIIVALSSIAGSLASILFSWFPPLRAWYDPKSTREKKLWMIPVVVFSALVVWLIGCNQLIPGFASLTCDSQGFSALILAVFLALGSNQSTYQIMPRPDDEE